MKNAISRIFVSALACLPLACKSSSGSADVPCTCGSPEADLDGCAHALCVAGKHNPDNPDCVCGTLSLPRKN